MRSKFLAAVCAAGALVSVGCVVEVRPPVVEAQVDTAGPVVDDPSVVAVDLEPDPAERVYVYDPGYPPGTYFYGGFYYYGGYRYPHDVFVNRYVNANIRENRFADADANRRAGAQIEERQRADFTRNGGRRPAPQVARRPAKPEKKPPGEPYQYAK